MDTAPIGTQIITIDPVEYVAAVYAPFRERLTQAKADAEKITGMDVQTKEGMALAIKHRAIFRSIRLEAEAARKQRKDPILTISKLIDGKYAELKTEIAEYEDSFDAPIKAEEERKELERTAAARELERKRIEAEQAAKRAEEERIAAEKAEIARQREELAKAEQARIEAEKQARLKIEEAERESRRKIEEEERVARQAREAEEARLKAERDRLFAENQTLEAKARAAQILEDARLKALREADEAAARRAATKTPTEPAAQTNIPQGAARSCESINGTASSATASSAPTSTGIAKLHALIGQITDIMTAGELQQVLDFSRSVVAARGGRKAA